MTIDEGYLHLRDRIYQLAADDFINAILDGYKSGERENEQFLTSGAYLFDRSAGKLIVDNCRKAIKTARGIIDDFLSNSDLVKRIYVDENDLTIEVMKRIIRREYSAYLRIVWNDAHTKAYLVWKKRH